MAYVVTEPRTFRELLANISSNINDDPDAKAAQFERVKQELSGNLEALNHLKNKLHGPQQPPHGASSQAEALPPDYFAAVDTNGDGVIDRAEWRQAISPSSRSAASRAPSETGYSAWFADRFLVEDVQRVPTPPPLHPVPERPLTDKMSPMMTSNSAASQPHGIQNTEDCKPSPMQVRDALVNDKETVMKENDALRNLWTELEGLRSRRPKADYQPMVLSGTQ